MAKEEGYYRIIEQKSGKGDVPNILRNDLVSVWSNVHIEQILHPVNGAVFRLHCHHAKFGRGFD